MMPSTSQLNSELKYLKFSFENLALSLMTIGSILEANEEATMFLRKDLFTSFESIEKKYHKYSMLDADKFSEKQAAGIIKLQSKISELNNSVKRFIERYAKAYSKNISVLDSLCMHGGTINEYEEYEWQLVCADDIGQVF